MIKTVNQEFSTFFLRVFQKFISLNYKSSNNEKIQTIAKSLPTKKISAEKTLTNSAFLHLSPPPL